MLAIMNLTIRKEKNVITGVTEGNDRHDTGAYAVYSGYKVENEGASQAKLKVKGSKE